jgi:hypothetical protein
VLLYLDIRQGTPDARLRPQFLVAELRHDSMMLLAQVSPGHDTLTDA